MSKMFKILKRSTVESVTGMSRSTIYAKIAEGTFPKPIRLTARSVGWIEQEVQEWIKSRIVASRGEMSNED